MNIEAGFGAWPLGLALLQSLTEALPWKGAASSLPVLETV
jgi:hypothetical protein